MEEVGASRTMPIAISSRKQMHSMLFTTNYSRAKTRMSLRSAMQRINERRNECCCKGRRRSRGKRGRWVACATNYQRISFSPLHHEPRRSRRETTSCTYKFLKKSLLSTLGVQEDQNGKGLTKIKSDLLCFKKKIKKKYFCL